MFSGVKRLWNHRELWPTSPSARAEETLVKPVVVEPQIFYGAIAPNRESLNIHGSRQLTSTPHWEVMGRVVTRHTGFGEPDLKTKSLVTALHDMDSVINSVTVKDNHIDLGFEKKVSKGFMREIGEYALDLAAYHLNIHNPMQLELYHQTQKALDGEIATLIISAMNQGIPPPEGWTHRQ